jgi:hypothetical protein
MTAGSYTVCLGSPMLTPAQITEFKTQGYLRSAKVLDDDQVEILRAEVERVITERAQ